MLVAMIFAANTLDLAGKGLLSSAYITIIFVVGFAFGASFTLRAKCLRCGWAKSFFLTGLVCLALPLAGTLFPTPAGDMIARGAIRGNNAETWVIAANAISDSLGGFIGLFSGIMFVTLAYVLIALPDRLPD